MTLKFTISSHKNFYEKTLDIIVPSLIDSGIPKESIYFFIGGYDTYESIDNSYGISLYKASHNSIDFTGLISVLDLKVKADYWFLLHDTCMAGKNFYNLISKVNLKSDTIALTSHNRSMNMGAYSQQHIHNNKDKLNSYRGSSSVDFNVQKLKRRLIDEEDILLLSKNKHSFSKVERKVIDSKNYYNSDVRRITEYFSDIDFYKMKSNWKPKKEYELNI